MNDLTRVRAPRLRSVILFGLACALVASMASLAIASAGRGPSSAIPEATLDRMLNGRVSAPRLPAPHVAIPSTPAGKQLAWLLTEVNGGSSTLTPSEVRVHVSGAFLSVLSADRLVRLLKEATNVYGALRLTAFSGRASAALAMVTVTTSAQRKLVIHVRVDGGVHPRITDLDISDRA